MSARLYRVLQLREHVPALQMRETVFLPLSLALLLKRSNGIMTDLLSPVFLGTLTVEQIYQDRDQFASLVREVAAPDVGRMGIEILSFTIKVSSLQPGPVYSVVRELCVALKEYNM